MWFLSALAVAVLIAMTAQLRGAVIWWNVLLIAAAVSISEFLINAFTMKDLQDAPWFLAVTIVLFVGVQLSRLVSWLVGRVPI
jgi:hypothetical protein